VRQYLQVILAGY